MQVEKLLYDFTSQTISTWNDNVTFTDEEEMYMLLYSCAICAYTDVVLSKFSEEKLIEYINDKCYKRYPPLKQATLKQTFDFVNVEMKKLWHTVATYQNTDVVNNLNFIQQFLVDFTLVIIVASYMMGYDSLREFYNAANSYKPTKKHEKLFAEKRLIVKKTQVEAKKANTKSNALRKKNYDKIDEEFKKDIWDIDHERVGASIKHRCMKLINKLESGEISNTSAGKDLIVYADYLMKLFGWTFDDVKDVYEKARKEFE